MTAPTLRKYQHDALDAIWTAYERGTNRILIQKATGLGKTVTFAALLEHAKVKAWLETFPARERKMLVIAHREELITQAADKIHRANPDLHIGIEQGDSHAGPFSDVIVASVQTLSAMKYRRLERLMSYGAIRIVIVDEAHHATATTYRNCLVRLGFLPKAEEGDDTDDAAGFLDAAALATALREWETSGPKDRLLVGFTATPNRSDNVGLGAVFQTIAYTYPIKKAIDDKWLVPITPWVVDTKVNLDEVRITAGEFNQRDLAETVNTADRNEIAVAAWGQYAKGLPTIAFTVDVAHAKAVAFAFQCRGVKAEMVSGETPKEERRQILADYSAGKVTLIANCMVLTEGTDLPTTSCILHLKPTKSATLYEQMTGRGLRLHPGKTECVVIDVVDIARRHSLQSAPVLYGLPPMKPEGKNLNVLADELEALQALYPSLKVEALIQERGPLTLEQLRAHAKTFDIWSVPALGAVGEGLSLNWIKVGDDVYRIQYPWGDGTEVLKVERNMLGRFDVSCTLRPSGAPYSYARRNVAMGSISVSVRQQTIVANVDGAHAALRNAEAFIRSARRTVLRLKDKDAPWRKPPASEKQIEILRKRRIPFKPNLTKGEASDLLDLASARSGR